MNHVPFVKKTHEKFVPLEAEIFIPELYVAPIVDDEEPTAFAVFDTAEGTWVE